MNVSARTRRIGLRTLSLAVFLGAWWLVAELDVWSDLFVPDPTSVFERLIDGETTHDGIRGLSGYYLHEHLWHSLWRILRGLFWAIAVGVPLGLALATVAPFRVIVEPYVTFIRALPPLAYFSLLIIWFGIDESPKIWLLAIAAMPPVAVATAAAVVGAPTALVEAARAMGARGWQVTTTVVLPAALPEISTGIRLAVGIAYSSLVAAETVNGLPGIGGMIRQAQTFLQSDVVILGLFAIGLSGLAIDGVLRAIERRLIPWRGRG